MQHLGITEFNYPVPRNNSAPSFNKLLSTEFTEVYGAEFFL